ncbi:MAG TPA: chemotaxis response regulator protein-glutamate methylesterase [Lysinibacillus sp.]|uniref:Protein-glutamate methylesterase/protein-glutamine glutaminase n=1 Tax=Lysinibacillus fusiformis TaxID=28031 RepID=A0A2I0V4M8_9BACI|nr:MULTISPECIES: chemotaxis response regulator protein-glutamate methylesterase [Lysinibacillus]MEE3807035.1 chemotaxis response regulator protein-glutamate methylesterase [Lysinibacillus fusiformis]PKU53255.1 chemotaxis response regulator protein-glutamate methylesterase [Lysinibacillus fusiformis]WCH48787.1 chemotaxis response regulator protein-glutamate methylesterase [Lysinibacillus sp. OF-1]HBT72715.1 chemotaxis response regulator protein-glutamate methylesterase [Lysinibacillus sp.]
MDFLHKSKLLVVDDSAFMRKLISDFFVGNSKVEVVGTARNGKDAIKKIQSLKPTVVTMDIEMPEMNGLDALKEIMIQCPVPVIMLSSTTQRGTENAIAAIESGAVDFVAKPSGTISLDLHKIQNELVHKVEQAAMVPISKLKKPSGSKKQQEPVTRASTVVKEPQQHGRTPTLMNVAASNVATSKPLVEWSKVGKKMVLIGTSTGGPRALQEVITKIPKSIQAPILIVQHMPAGFTKSLATRLDQLSEIAVKEAEQGDILQNGVAYIAPGGYHLKLRKVGTTFGIVLDNQEAPRSGHRPSVDVMFEDVSQYKDFDKVAVIMTGMGHDGSNGLKALKKSGNVIAIAESAETCIVYGMPKAAVETQLVDEVADVDDIAQTIMKYLP